MPPGRSVARGPGAVISMHNDQQSVESPWCIRHRRNKWKIIKLLNRLIVVTMSEGLISVMNL